eukprot:TRINITY_DN3514_c0_g2_i1.p1 TRINITY_DN3514_c0_g2~~TRINITY_DN3514_c0_g2_i1.p1  ORF type:complete len:140 (+),score=36.05 TRINITY_DN3514_c0_g2_i1:525-944(+)
MNHHEKRIFAFDKPNKFFDDFLLKRIMIEQLARFIKWAKTHQNAFVAVVEDELVSQIRGRIEKIEASTTLESLEKYYVDIFQRDEFDYELLYNFLLLQITHTYINIGAHVSNESKAVEYLSGRVNVEDSHRRLLEQLSK